MIAARPVKSLVLSLMASNGAIPLSTGAQPGGAVHSLVARRPWRGPAGRGCVRRPGPGPDEVLDNHQDLDNLDNLDNGSDAMDTYVTVTGNLTGDPTQRATASGATVVHLRVAASGRKFDRASGEFRDGDPMFINVSCWRSLGGNVFASLRKGDSVIVHGRLLYRSYDDKAGNRHNVHEIDAIAVGPDLSRCAADLRRASRAAQPAVAAEPVAGTGPVGREAVPAADGVAPTPSPVAA
jgi:single-strand DNA-binding protein